MNMRSIRALASAVAGFAALAGTARGDCPNSEPPSDGCGAPRYLSGAQGVQTIIMNTSTATGLLPTACSVPIGHTVWFSITPSVSGLLTFSTCHPSTTYDTVVEAYSGGDAECNVMAPVLCVDDTPDPACSNGCSAYGARLAFNVTAGVQYRIVVGSYNNNSAGCNLCLGVTVTLCGGDPTPPEISLASPAVLACVCPGSVTISGSVNDSDTGIASYVLEYAAVANPVWTQLASGRGNVFGNLAVWDTTALPEADYYLRLTAVNGCGGTTSTVRTVHVDAALDSVQLRFPASGNILGGTVIADGAAWDHCPPGQWRVYWVPQGGTAQLFTPLLPDNIWVYPDPMASWNSRAVVDGNYTVRLVGTSACGSSVARAVDVVIDNTAPIAVISMPASCQGIPPGILQVRGTAQDAHLASWALQYTGGDTHSWVTINSGATPVINSVLTNWDTRGLRPCAYALRLIVTDAAIIDSNGALRNQTEYLSVVDLGCPADFNRSGLVSVQDIFDFLAGYFAGCP